MTYLSLTEYPAGVSVSDANTVLFDLSEETAHLGQADSGNHCLVWRVTASQIGDADLSVEIDLNRDVEWVLRCDRIDFPPGGVAYTHTHPGPGIRRLLFGELDVTAGGSTRRYSAGGSWFESGPEPVLAVASSSAETAFVRVLVLPAEWRGKRTIRYVNPEDEDRPKLQKATVYLEGDMTEIEVA